MIICIDSVVTISFDYGRRVYRPGYEIPAAMDGPLREPIRGSRISRVSESISARQELSG